MTWFRFLPAMFLLAPAIALADVPVPQAALHADVFQVTPQTPVPQGATRVPVLRVLLQASCTSDVTVSSMTIGHSGAGNVTDISRLYAMRGTLRVSRTVSLRRDEPTELLLNNVVIPKCKRVELNLFADFSADAVSGSIHTFSIDSIDADATVDIAASESAVPSKYVVPSRNASAITAEFLPVTRVNYGKNRVVARLQLSIDGATDHAVTAITFTNKGSASDNDLRNLSVFTRRGERVSAITSHMDGKIVRIVFEKPLLLDVTKAVELRADVRSSYKKTLRWEIESPSDIEAYEVRSRR